jgi:hypothetical protein
MKHHQCAYLDMSSLLVEHLSDDERSPLTPFFAFLDL